MKLKMKRKPSLRRKAAIYNGKSRACTKCPFAMRNLREDVCKVCSEAFIEGFQKGYKLNEKEHTVSENSNGNS